MYTMIICQKFSKKIIKMVNKCYLCKATTKGSVSVHRMPRDEATKRNWLKALRLSDTNSDIFICSAHFRCSDFYFVEVKGRLKRYLNYGAIPSCNLNPEDNKDHRDCGSNECKMNNNVCCRITSDMDIDNLGNIVNELGRKNFERNMIKIEHNYSKSTFSTGDKLSDEESRNNPVHEHDEDSASKLQLLMDERKLALNEMEKINGVEFGSVHGCEMSFSLENVDELKENPIEIDTCCSRSETADKTIFPIPSKLPRYIGDLRPEHFVDKTAWEVFKKYRDESKKEMANLKDKLRRRKTRIRLLEDQLSYAKKKSYLNIRR